MKAAGRTLAALGARAEVAVRSKKAARRISTGCGTSITALAATARQDLP